MRTKTLAVYRAGHNVIDLRMPSRRARTNAVTFAVRLSGNRSSPEELHQFCSRVCLAGTVKGEESHGLTGTTYFVLDGVAPAPSAATGFKSTTRNLHLLRPG